jgi:unsaturated rhamnogalacturonyl hydrolase
MKSIFSRFNFAATTILFLAASFQLRAQDLVTDLITTNNSSAITPQSVLSVMQRAADWELAHLDDNKRGPKDWVAGTFDAGLMSLVGISGDTKYRDAALTIAEKNNWELGPHKYMADDQCVGQMYAELYLLYRDPKMIAPMQKHLDAILANPPTNTDLNFSQPGHGQDNWNWCDSLFMAPPTWMRLYAATGDERYMNFAVSNWWRTTDYLYDKDEHLYFRDSTYFTKKEANGQKVFWSRGNGWVMGGLVRMLQSLPMNSPDRPRFEQLFKDMSDKILSCQQSDGLWRGSLLDPADFPGKETSGSGFFTYALAWGVNQGLLDKHAFEPAIRKAWTALVGCVDADGKVTNVQPIGADPKNFDANSTEPYGVGAFLLAGSEVYRMAALEKPFIKVTVSNPAKFYRSSETVELNVEDILKAFGSEMPKRAYETPFLLQRVRAMAVMDGVSSQILPSQTYVEPNFPWKYIFQVDLAPNETRTFYILDGSALAAEPQPIVKTFARYVPERHEDFAWESDRIAHRIFGAALETWKAEPLTSSGVDVWIKRTRNLVVNHMYATMNFFDVNGPAQDDFKVGKTRGDGGLGIWKDGKLYVSANWHNYKIITTGPIRSEFELTYDAWDVGGRKISETKRISIDAGSNMSRVESTFSSDDNSPVQIGVGLGERPGENSIVQDGAPEIDSFQNSTAKGLFVQNKDEGWMSYWQPQDFSKGVTAVAFILPKGSVDSFTTDIPNLSPEKTAAPTKTITEGQPAIRNQLGIATAEIGKPFVYYIGAGWSESGDFPNAKAWNDYIRTFAERRDQPLQVTVGQ